MTTNDAAGAHMSNAVTGQVLAFVECRAGAEGVDRLRALSGDARPREELTDLSAWSSWAQGKALLEAAAEVLGSSRALRGVVDEWVRSHAPGEVITVLQALGSPEAVLSAMNAIAAKFSPMVAMDPVAVAAGEATIAAVSAPGFERFPALCDFSAGLLAIVPRLFGLERATVEEDQCETRGDSRCLFRVTWRQAPASPADEIAFLRGELAALNGRLDSFQQTARDLVSGQDLESLLATITARAATAVRAPAYLLAVTAGEDIDERVVHSGLDEQHVDSLLDELRTRRVLEDASRLVVDIASGRRQYGWLAALYPNGARFLPGEHHLLAAYAELAAAALDSGTALARARREHATAAALLELAADFATVTSESAVAERLLRIIPKVVTCDFSTVHSYDTELGGLVPTALGGFPDSLRDLLMATPVTLEDTPLLAPLLEHPEPHFIESTTEDRFLRPLMAAAGAAALVIVPVVRRDTFYGVLTAGVWDRPARLRRDPEVVTRLRGLADQAAAAFHNAQLLQHVRDQALVDPLTGLPNRIPLEDRTRRALATNERDRRHTCLLFVDLDGFKAVNDTHGHAAGDELLRLVAVRLSGVLRASDMLARLGGDEFAILVADAATIAEAEVVAERVVASLRCPFRVVDRDVALTCSVGVAASPGNGLDFDALLARADAAMYDAKRHGGGRHRAFACSDA